MNRPAWTVFLAIAFILLFVAAPMTVAAADALDGKAYVAMIDGKEDVLSFADGMFHSSACDEWGFGKGAYTTMETDAGTAFEATTTSDEHGTMAWSGTLMGDTLKGSYTWTRSGMAGMKSDTVEFEAGIKQ